MTTRSGSSGDITINGSLGRSLQFGDQGITVRNLFRTHQIGWAEVRRFADGPSIWEVDGSQGGKGDPGLWVLAIALHDRRTVAASATMGSLGWGASARARSKAVPLAIVQAAQRYGIPADLRGTIERGSFPATLLGESGTITVTICDGHLAEADSEAILEVVHRTEPVEPGDILALSQDGAEVEVVAVRQVVADGRWEQVAYAYLPAAEDKIIARPRFWQRLTRRSPRSRHGSAPAGRARGASRSQARAQVAGVPDGYLPGQRHRADVVAGLYCRHADGRCLHQVEDRTHSP